MLLFSCLSFPPVSLPLLLLSHTYFFSFHKCYTHTHTHSFTMHYAAVAFFLLAPKSLQHFCVCARLEYFYLTRIYCAFFPTLFPYWDLRSFLFIFYCYKCFKNVFVCVFGLCATPRFVFIKRNKNIFSISMSSMCCMMLYIAYRSVYTYSIFSWLLDSAKFQRFFAPFSAFFLPCFVGFFSGRIQPKVVERGSRLESTFMRPRQRATWTQNTRSSNSSSRQHATGGSREEAAGRRQLGGGSRMRQLSNISSC